MEKKHAGSKERGKTVNKNTETAFSQSLRPTFEERITCVSQTRNAKGRGTPGFHEAKGVPSPFTKPRNLISLFPAPFLCLPCKLNIESIQLHDLLL